MKPLVVPAALAALLALAAVARAAGSGPIAVVAAENFYGDVARQIGGPEVAVTSILNNPDQDPHLFEASPSVARAVAAARVVVYNGLGYDPWMAKLLAAASGRRRETIAAAALVGRTAGDNPHLWYDPRTMPAVARELAAALGRLDPARRQGYAARLARFEQSLRPMAARIAALRGRLAGTPATATEPIFGHMFEALGMQVKNRRFQLAVMNNTEPSAADIAAFQTALETRRVGLLVYNSQASGPLAERMVRIAEAAGIPVVAVTETEPTGTTYQAWMASTLDAVARAVPK